MGKCAVFLCKNYSGKTKNISFHPFPVDPKRKIKWVDAVRREAKWIPTKHHRICSIHFTPECFNSNAKNYKRLHKDAIPTLNLPNFIFDTGRERISENMEVTQQEDTKPCLVNPLNGTSHHNADDTPQKIRLKKQIHEKNKKIKRLQYINRFLAKKVASLEEILENLTSKT